MSGDVDAKEVKFKENSIQDLGKKYLKLDGCFWLNRFNSDQYVFIINIINRKYDLINKTIDVFLLDYVNCRIYIFVGGGWII